MEYDGDIRLIEDLGLFVNPGRVGKGGSSTRMWRVECPKCSKQRDVQAGQIKKSGHSVCRNCSNGYKGATHNLSKHRLYNLWSQMKARCSNPKAPFYGMYGGAGIKVCKAWLDFKVFYDWSMANGYAKGLTLDRINGKRGYSPANCRWTTKKVQTRNTKKLSARNTTGYRGVGANRNGKRWRAFITVDGKTIYLGTFDTKREAAKTYDDYVIENKLEHTRNF